MSAPKRVYFDLAREAIAKAGVEECLVRRPCVVLERIARGAGATNWFYCRELARLPSIVACLHPSSMVSFYFDERIKRAPWTDATRAEVLALIKAHAEIVFGRFARQDTAPTDTLFEIDASLVMSAEEVDDHADGLRSHVPVFFGEFPGKEQDGENVFTLVLPDEDGETRAHPY